MFKHVTSDHEFKDDHLFYRYHDDPFAGHSGSVNGSCADFSLLPIRGELAKKADSFKVHVDVRDRKTNMKLYKQCFIGRGKT